MTSTSTYLYDGLGRRMEKNVDGAITRYLYDNEDILLELDGNNNILAQYTHGPGIDEPLIMERDGQSYYYHTDGLGSVVVMTDAAGAVVQTYRYDSFGRIVKQVGGVLNAYTYTARELDAESGVYYYRERYYNSSLGSFTSEDPIVILSGSLNAYSYVTNNPINNADPLGLYIYNSPINLFSPFPINLISILIQLQKKYEMDCGESFIKCMGEILVAPGWSTWAQGLGDAASYYYTAKAWQHAASRLLTYPLRSSIVRGFLLIGKNLGFYTTLAIIDIAGIYCLYFD